ncbi:MAG: WYL domain-containing protein [bacterium]|nr:WYL domain-containing protein [bacterium]
MPVADDGRTEVSQSQLERLAFIDFRAYFLGEVRRTDIIEQFKVKEAAASRDISKYKERGGRITLDGSTKAYRPDPNFSPLFPHPVERVFSALCQGFGEGSNQNFRPLVPCEIPHQLNTPSLEAIAIISRAIHQRRVVYVEYSSFSSGKTEREIVPHALANTGARWHVRAFDRRRKRFTDFVLTRIRHPVEIGSSPVHDHELSINDHQWNRIVELEIVPHPGSKHQEIIATDYGMKNRHLYVNVRASLAGYFLRQWAVDCSPEHSIGPDAAEDGSNDAVRLWLKNYLALYGVETAKLAPGYKSPAP